LPYTENDDELVCQAAASAKTDNGPEREGR